VRRLARWDHAGRNAQEAMGFERGWGIALDQLVALMQVQG
jgi:uncharacterized protein YndB with AHSA1/START domain